MIIGNDVGFTSGGAGITEFSGVQKTYSGLTIINNSVKGGIAATMQIGADNVLPPNTTLQFGYIPDGLGQ